MDDSWDDIGNNIAANALPASNNEPPQRQRGIVYKNEDDIVYDLPQNIFSTSQEDDSDNMTSTKEERGDTSILSNKMKDAIFHMEEMDNKLFNAELKCKESDGVMVHTEEMDKILLNVELECTESSGVTVSEETVDDGGSEGQCSANSATGVSVSSTTMEDPSQGKQLDHSLSPNREGPTSAGIDSSLRSHNSSEHTLTTSCQSGTSDENKVGDVSLAENAEEQCSIAANEDAHINDLVEDNWYSLVPSCLDTFGDIEFTSSESIVGSAISDAQSTMYGSVQSSIARNKSLCSLYGGRLLTAEEEERISELLSEEDHNVEKYGMTSMEEEIDAEVDSRLSEFGICFENDDTNFDVQKRGGDVAIEDEETGKNRSAAKGDPVLKDLAEKRVLDEKERSVDDALRALLREPLQRVLRCLDAHDEDSTLSTEGGNSVFTAPLTERDIKRLVEKVKHDLEADKLELANHISIRWLVESIVKRGMDRKTFHTVA